MSTQQSGENGSGVSSSDGQDFWQSETISLIALSSMSGVGYWTLRKLALSGITFQEVTQAKSKLQLTNYLKQSECKIIDKVVETWFESHEKILQQANKLYFDLRKQEIEVIHFKEKNFPQYLREIKDPPQWLFVQGDISVLHQPAITIVGTRKPTQDGKFLAQYVGRSLPYFKGVTVSGLASGIDQIIHKNSLRFNIKTIAFIGTGILLNYPSGSEKLRQEIYQKGGAIVSEYLPHDSYSAANFVHRNRLQAGLARVVIPVEWQEKGGTAHTVRFAKENNRKIICLRQPGWDDSHTELSVAKEMGAEVFTIPGQESEFRKAVQQCLELNTKKKGVKQDEESMVERNLPLEQDYQQLELFPELKSLPGEEQK